MTDFNNTEIRHSKMPAKTVIALVKTEKDCCSSNCKRAKSEPKSCATSNKGLNIAKFLRFLTLRLFVADTCQERCSLSTNQNANIK